MHKLTSASKLKKIYCDLPPNRTIHEICMISELLRKMDELFEYFHSSSSFASAHALYKLAY